jgi:hypothetical protein
MQNPATDPSNISSLQDPYMQMSHLIKFINVNGKFCYQMIGRANRHAKIARLIGLQSVERKIEVCKHRVTKASRKNLRISFRHALYCELCEEISSRRASVASYS